MVAYYKGKVIEKFIGGPSAMMFDCVDGVVDIFVHVSPDLIDEFELGGHYDYACGRINHSVFICVKWGDNAWSSMPFTPHLANGEFPKEYEAGVGMPVNVILVNTANGEIVQMDMMSLTNEFSNGLSQMSHELLGEPFDIMEHKATINAVYEHFATDDELAEALPLKCHID